MNAFLKHKFKFANNSLSNFYSINIKTFARKIANVNSEKKVDNKSIPLKSNKKTDNNINKNEPFKREKVKSLKLSHYFPDTVSVDSLNYEKYENFENVASKQELQMQHRDSLNKFQVKFLKKVSTIRQNVIRQLDDKSL